MFSDLLESVASNKRTSRPWTVLVSVVLQSACLLVLILFPLVYTRALPASVLTGTPLPPYLVPPPAQVAQDHAASQPARGGGGTWIHVPPSLSLSAGHVRGRGVPDFHGSLSVGPDEIGPGGPAIFASEFGPGLGPAGPTGPPTPPAPASPPSRVKRGGDVEAARIISRPEPVYPDWARRAGIQGEVVLHAIISTDGRILELQVLSGNLVLARAALDAVQQWRYQPTLLNGQPVEVETTITVKFVLGR
ncbi:MAG: energy transducer TonB [Candidatus Acidiferrales bacterium]